PKPDGPSSTSPAGRILLATSSKNPEGRKARRRPLRCCGSFIRIDPPTEAIPRSPQLARLSPRAPPGTLRPPPPRAPTTALPPPVAPTKSLRDRVEATRLP